MSAETRISDRGALGSPADSHNFILFHFPRAYALPREYFNWTVSRKFHKHIPDVSSAPGGLGCVVPMGNAGGCSPTSEAF